MSRDVQPVSKETQLHGPRTLCSCGCGQEGALRGRRQEDGARHVRGCSCRPCIGARNRRSGKSKQRAGAKALKVPDPKFRGQMGHEEMYLGTVRLEIKSGKQVEGAWKKYLACEDQSTASKAVGDTRHFLALWMPPGTTDGLFVGRLSHIRELVEALYEQLSEPA